MEYTKITKPITLQSHIPTDKNECECPICGGIGWLNNNDKYIEKCPYCINGIVKKCEYCGQPMIFNSYNKETERYNRATHYNINSPEINNMDWFYSDLYGDNGYFSEIGDIIDYCNDRNEKIPKYIWCTKIIPFSIDATDIIDRCLEKSYEDAMDNINDKELNKLQTACNNFVEAHHGRLDTYEVDYTKCIDLK